jgi:hypothetical protein
LISNCLKHNDISCATALSYQAVKQLRRAPDSATLPLSLSELASAVAPVNEELAFEMLDEAVWVSNAHHFKDTELGRPAINAEVFKTLAAKNEVRARQSADALKERLSRISALAAIYHRKAAELTGNDVPSPETNKPKAKTGKAPLPSR